MKPYGRVEPTETGRTPWPLALLIELRIAPNGDLTRTERKEAAATSDHEVKTASTEFSGFADQNRRGAANMEACRCARTASTTRAARTGPGRRCANATSTLLLRRRGGVRRTAPRSNRGWPTSTGSTAPCSARLHLRSRR